MYKNNFGHVLILAGSGSMLGAAALTSLAAMRSGVGLVTVGIPESLNNTLQKKISPIVMTLPLAQTRKKAIAASAVKEVRKFYTKCNVIAIGPGLSLEPQTQKFIREIIATSPKPLVIDADGLNALAGHLHVLKKTNVLKILTPHPGEMARLLKIDNREVETHREKIVREFVKNFGGVCVLKGHRTIVADEKNLYVNTTGNAGMATAGSGDVLTGMIAAFLAQGLSAFEAAKWGVYLHGKAGDLAAKDKGKISLIATDLIDYLPQVLKGKKYE